MREFILHDKNGYADVTITRSLKTIPLYNIHCSQAEDEIGWASTRLVPLTEAELIVYFQSGRSIDVVEQFRLWADACERSDID